MPHAVTWLLPVKNGLPFLPEALRSIEAQTCRDWEVLAWDNGSTDGSVDVLDEWVPSRLPGRIVADQPLGLGACLARMVEAAETDLCARLDSDDVALPERLEKQIAFLSDNPGVAVVGTNVMVIDDQGRQTPSGWELPCDDAELRWRLRFASGLMHPTVLFRRSAVLEAGNYRDMKPGQDYDLWLRVSLIAKLANLPGKLVRYRQHDQTISSNTRVPGSQMNRQLVERYVDRLFPGVEREAALRVHELVTAQLDGPVTRCDIAVLKRAARAAAPSAGEAPLYFQRTGRFRRQLKGLRLRWLKQLPLIGPVVRALGAARRQGSRAEPRSMSH